MNYGKNSDNATKLKRPTPAHMFEKRFCKWCAKEIIRKRHTLSQWNTMQACSQSCASLWSHYRKSLSEMPPENADKRCLYCNAPIVRRPDEKRQSWLKRLYCNKSHAAYAVKVRPASKAMIKSSIIKPIESTPESKVGLIQYTPGTEEFNKLAEYYLARGF